MAINLDRVGWQDGTLVSPAKVVVGGTTYNVTPEQYSGTTPLSAQNLKTMENNTERAINEGMEESTYASNTYSTTETRIGTWTSGKPLYRKVINIGNLPNSTFKDVAHGISNIGTVINMYGYFYNPSNTTYNPIPYVSTGSDTSNQVGIYVYGSSVRILSGTDRSNCTGYVVLEYTKITD